MYGKDIFKVGDTWVKPIDIPEPCQECHYWVRVKCVAYDCKYQKGVKDERGLDKKYEHTSGNHNLS